MSGLARQELLVVTGKGGVGKSTVSVCLGRALTRVRGERVLLLEADRRESLHRLLGLRPSGGEILEAGDGLYLQSVRPREVLDRLVRDRIRIDAVAGRVLASPIYRHFAEGAPGLQGLLILWHALDRLRRPETNWPGTDGPPVDRVILDAPATGHGLSLLRAPGLVADVIRQGPVGELTGRVADWLNDPGALGLVLVTLAEEMPVTEALELRQAFETDFDRAPDLLVANGLYPRVPSAAETDPDDPWGRLWRRRRQLNERELGRLRRKWRRPDLELPLLPVTLGPSVLSELEHRFDPWLAEASA